MQELLHLKHDADLMVAEIETLKAQTVEMEELRAQVRFLFCS